MMEEDQDKKLSKRKKRLLFILFLLLAMMLFLDMLIISVFPKNPWTPISFEGTSLIFKILIYLFAYSKPVYQPYSLISLYFENKWIIIHFFFVFVFVDNELMKFSERVLSKSTPVCSK